ncbi:DUF4407 domain-containing protein [Parafrankia discariae]|uniref:DUF4407 domain-containing protein n=1 Tax=Parafrankia discariae TaxID=365528 RepID=UPI00037AF052|nr:DUF4407 domain-containing protein [Parafrankia discariae]
MSNNFFLGSPGPGGPPGTATPDVTRRQSRVTRILLWLSGANTEILNRFPSDVAKYVGIGGAVLTTSTMAAISCAFALRMALGLNPFFYLILGLAWGFAIMSLDRWLVVSMQRRDHWYQILPVALPRLVLALLIGVVISTPLVLRIFEAEITTELAQMRSERESAFLATSQTDERGRRITALTAERDQLQNTIDSDASVDVSKDPEVIRVQGLVDAKQTEYNQAEQNVVCENEGTCGSTRVGRGPAYAEKVAIRDRLKGELDELKRQLTTAQQNARTAGESTRGAEVTTARSRLTEVSAELETLTGQRTESVNSFRKENGKENGLLIRMEALDNLTAHRPALGLAHRFLLVFITAIECLPIIVKFFISIGPPTDYEQAVALDGRSRLRAEEDRIRQRRADTILENTGLHRRRQLGWEMGAEAVEQASEAALEQYKRRALRQARRNPEQFLFPQSFSTGPAVPAQQTVSRRSWLDSLLGRPRSQPVTAVRQDDGRQPYPSGDPVQPPGPFFDGDSGDTYGRWGH